MTDEDRHAGLAQLLALARDVLPDTAVVVIAVAVTPTPTGTKMAGGLLVAANVDAPAVRAIAAEVAGQPPEQEYTPPGRRH